MFERYVLVLLNLLKLAHRHPSCHIDLTVLMVKGTQPDTVNNKRCKPGGQACGY